MNGKKRRARSEKVRGPGTKPREGEERRRDIRNKDFKESR